MTEELKNYLIWYCREWMLPEEIRALARISLYQHDVEMHLSMAQKSASSEKIYGFKCEKTTALVNLGKQEMEIAIANRILNDHYEEVINNCPKCGKLARTPKAKQCRYCQFDWH